MRIIKKSQLQLVETDISRVKFDSKSRDDIPQLLRGLQYIYTTPDICNVSVKSPPPGTPGY